MVDIDTNVYSQDTEPARVLVQQRYEVLDSSLVVHPVIDRVFDITRQRRILRPRQMLLEAREITIRETRVKPPEGGLKDQSDVDC